LHTPLLDPFIINGRTLAGLQAKLAAAGATPILTAIDDSTLRLPRLSVKSADQVLHQATWARQRLNLHSYSGDDREFIDDIVIKGIKEPPIVVPVNFDAGASGASWVLEAVDGARRTTASHEIMATIIGESNPRLATQHWADGKGSFKIRDMTGADVLRARERLQFDSSLLDALFPETVGHSAQDKIREATWIRTVTSRSSAVRAFHRVRTCHAFVVLHVEAFDQHAHKQPAWHVVHDAVRQRHMPKAAPKQWNHQDVWALYALDLVDALVQDGHLNDSQREALLNPAAVTIREAPSAIYRNRLVAIADFAAKACAYDFRSLTNAVLAKSQERQHSHERAQIIGAHARLMIDRHEDAVGASIASTITSICRHRVFYKTECHPLGNKYKWFNMIDKDPAELHEAALRELVTTYKQTPEEREKVGGFGPHQRALGFLGGLALIMNPQLIKLDENLTRTGRGGRGGRPTDIGKNDPDALLQRMMRSPTGIAELHSILTATIHGESVEVDGPAALTETRLRTSYLTGVNRLNETARATAADEAVDQDPLIVWDRLIDQLKDAIGDLTEHVDVMRKHELTGEFTSLAFEEQGMSPEIAAALMPKLSGVSEFLAQAGAFGRIAGGRAGQR
jgi:hypothetical protein